MIKSSMRPRVIMSVGTSWLRFRDRHLRLILGYKSLNWLVDHFMMPVTVLVSPLDSPFHTAYSVILQHCH